MGDRREIDASAELRIAAEQAAKERRPHFRAEMLQKAGGMYTRSQTAELLGISPGAVDKLRQHRRLLGVSYGTENRYPAAQFKDGKTVAGLQPILEAFGDMNPWGQLQLLIAPIDENPKRSIFDLLAHGLEEVRYRQLIGLVRGWAN